MENAERLKKTLEDPACKHMLVSGASMVALKTVEACLNHGVKVTLVGISKDGETAIFLDEKGKTVGCPLSKLADEDAACIREAADGLERLIRIGKKWKPAK